MRSWGIVVTAFYVLVVTLLLSYGVILLAEAGGDEITGLPESFQDFAGSIVEGTWLPILILVCAQILLLFLSVDTSWRRMKTRRHAMVTAGLVGLMIVILTFAAFFAIGMAYSGDNFFDITLDSWFQKLPEDSDLPVVLATILLIWGFWGVLFYVFTKRASNVVDSAVGWLIKGSVLELLIAVPCHIIVRQRDDCCAPFISAYGIATGIAIMLMAFGPSALLLYQRKLQEYKIGAPD
jgi:hypothetical protein